MRLSMLIILLFSCGGQAQEVTLALPDTFCRIDQFSERMGKLPSPQFKICDSLKDKLDVKVSSFEVCKKRALDLGEKCIKILKTGDQVAVRGKFTEKFSVSQNSTTFTCELGRSGTSSCP